MRINPNSLAGHVAQTSVKPPAKIDTRHQADRTEFEQASALNSALAEAPTVRADEVARAKELVKDSGYPPPYALTRIARLLAIHMKSDDE